MIYRVKQPQKECFCGKLSGTAPVKSTNAAIAGGDDVTQLLTLWRKGDEQALARLIPVVYQELRSRAAAYMEREASGHTLQATALVHEAYLRLAGQKDHHWENRIHFFATAASIMRNLLVDYARARRRNKRGGGCDHLPLDEVPTLAASDLEHVLAVDEALTRLSQLDARAARIVELRHFVGLTVPEAAEVIGVSEKTVKRDWEFAKAWLQAELQA